MNGARVALRVDASHAMGTGHLMRCLTLADGLRARGAECLFLCAEHDGTAARLLNGHGLARLPAEPALDAGGPLGAEREAAARRDAQSTRERLAAFRADAVVVDHYRLDADWERAVKGDARLLAIDDLADRDHACDLLLDQNLFDAPESRYRDRLAPGCRPLLGPDYALLRAEFRRAREGMARRDGRIRRIQLFFGGTDPTGDTIKALHALSGLVDVELEVIAGAANPRLDELRRICAEEPRIELAVQVEDMARRMARADLAVGAVGAAYLERCAVGLPTVAVVTADNQREVAEVLARRGAIQSLGWHEGVDEATIREAVAALSADHRRVAALAQRSAAVMEGWRRGGTDAVVGALLEC